MQTYDAPRAWPPLIPLQRRRPHEVLASPYTSSSNATISRARVRRCARWCARSYARIPVDVRQARARRGVRRLAEEKDRGRDGLASTVSTGQADG